MLDVTLRVTRSPAHLDQIHHLGIVNKRIIDDGLFSYAAWVDGKPLEVQVSHFREDGALKLLQIVLEQYELENDQ